MANNIYLVGMMGSGKTSVTRLLADRLGRPFVDIDAEIVAQQKMAIADIFEKHGESYFRSLECSALERIAAFDSYVVATGGGVVLDEKNIDCMKKTGIVVYLKAPTDMLYSHIIKDGQARPLLSVPDPKSRLDALFAERKFQYEKADYIFSIEGKTPDQVTDGIVEMLELEGKL